MKMFLTPGKPLCALGISSRDPAHYSSFIAVIGESGLGKGTLRRNLTDRIYRKNASIVMIESYVMAMENNDHQGKSLKAASIAEAIVHAAVPLKKLKRSPKSRFHQLHRLLKERAVVSDKPMYC